MRDQAKRIKPGMVVMLNSSNVPMTVDRHGKPMGWLECVWFDVAGNLHRDDFDEEWLDQVVRLPPMVESAAHFGDERDFIARALASQASPWLRPAYEKWRRVPRGHEIDPSTTP